MTHCTVCGAAAREGAKFCTSCGARLVDPVSAAPAATDDMATVSEDVTIEAIQTESPASDDDPGGAEATWTSTVTGDATGQVDTVSVESDEPATATDEPAGIAEGQSTETVEYSSSWPAPEDEPAAEDAMPEEDATPARPESAWSSWASAADEPEPAGAPDSFATDADQDPEPRQSDTSSPTETSAPAPGERRRSPFATDADQDAQTDDDRGATTAGASEATAEPVDAIEGDADHHGASQWESWAPVASGEATVPSHGSDVGASVRRLLNDVATRIDQLIDPTTVTQRGVDANELADQLERWSRAGTDATGLVEVVQAVRKSPRDVDALTRLADRAPDLELLVRHYQSITRGAGDWSRKLREGDTSGDA